jgi:hypothetical protein
MPLALPISVSLFQTFATLEKTVRFTSRATSWMPE